MRNIAKLCVSLAALGGAPFALAQQPRQFGNDPFSQGRFEEAEESYKAALARNPNDAAALAGLARSRLFDDDVDEAIELANRALAIAPGDASATRTLTVAQERKAAFGADRYRFTLDRPVAIKFVQTDPLPVVSVSIGSRQANFLIDTGGPNVILTKALADELGLPLTDGPIGTFAGGRQARTQRTLIPELALGSFAISNVPAGVLELPGMPFDGIIGTGLLMHFLSTLDYCRGELVLAPRSDSPRFQSEARNDGSNIGRMWLMGDHFILTRARFNHAPDGIFHVDTGFAGGGLMGTKEALDEAGIVVDTTNVVTGVGGGGAAQGVPFIASATWGNLTRHNITGRYSIGGDQFGVFPFKVKGVLSHQFFRESRLTFDFEAMRMVTQQCSDPNVGIRSGPPQPPVSQSQQAGVARLAAPADVSIPNTPAGRQFASWLQAFNSGDPAAMQEIVDRFANRDGPPVQVLQAIRQISGGFDVVRINQSTDTRLVALLKERGSEQFQIMTTEVEASPEHRIISMPLTRTATPPEFVPAKLTDEALASALRTRLDELAKSDTFSGAVLVLKDDKPIFSGAYGYADREAKIPNQLDTVFRYGSMGKMFTATAVLQLIQSGKLKLSDPVGTFLPDYPNQDIRQKVTIEHLLTHTGGTGDIFTPEWAARRTEIDSHADYVNLLGERAPLFEPGSQYGYSNYGFVLLGRIIEVASGEDYYDYLQDHIFEPAGMTSTGFWRESEPLARRANGYMRTPGGLGSNRNTVPTRGRSRRRSFHSN